MKKTIVIALLCSIFLLSVFFSIPRFVEFRSNSLYPSSEYLKNHTPPDLHNELFVADMHADTLLWNRDILKESSRGHLDFPRMIKGNIALQGFSIVTKSPKNINIDRNTGDTDNITLLALAQRWPVATWQSLSERALYQANKLREFAKKSDGRLALITSQNDLNEYVERRKTEKQITAGFLSVEGSHALEGDLSKLDSLYEAGVRMIAPTHFFDTEYSGSVHGVSKAGLSDLGTHWLHAVEKRKMIVDLAHASTQTIEDVLDTATRPIVISHTGVKAVCDNNRNLNDEQLLKIAKKNGLIGIGFWEEATCGTDVASIIKSILHAVKIMGVDHVALGSDFDGFVNTPFDASQIGAVTEGLQKAQVSEVDIRKIMGLNILNFFLKYLPEI